MSATWRARQPRPNQPTTRWTRSRRAIGRSALVAALAMAGATVLGTGEASAATSLNVSTTADIASNAGSCGNSNTTPPSPLSLREATCIATNLGGAVSINIPAGHYTLSNGELQPGKTVGSNVSLIGAGSASTIIDAANNSRVLDLDSNLQGGVTNSISNLTITGGKDDTFGGAGIIAGSNLNSTSDSLTLSNVVVSGNHANVASPSTTNRGGGGVQFEGGQLTITNSTFSGNSAGSSQGAGLYYLANGVASPEGLNINNSTFSGNAALSSSGDNASLEGGAVTLSGTPSTNYSITNSIFTGNTDTANAGSGSPVGAAIYEQSGNLTVTGSTFTNNSAAGGTGSPAGGAINVAGSAVATLHYNRFVGNTAPTGSAVAAAPSVNATENWWGCSTGPGTAGCDTTSGSVTASPRLVLTATASPAHVAGPNGTATLTASLLTDSAGGAVSASNLNAAFDGLPVSFADPAGDATVTSSAGAHSVNLASGTASIDYHSNTTLGPDNVAVTLDNATVTDVLEVDEAPAITSANTANFNVGTAGSFTITTTGYPNATLTESGTLPTGLTFTDNGDGSATLSGTPTGPGGTFLLNLTANNGVAPNATQTLTVSVGQPPAFTSGSTATFRVGNPGSFTVTTSGIPTVSTITESGTLPPNISFTDNGDGTATISGSPNGPGSTYPVTLTATNGVSPNATQNLTIQVNQAPAITSNPSNQTVQPGQSVSFSASAAGNPSPTVQWQRSTDGGASFNNVAGATSTTYTFTTASGDNGNQYRAVFSNGVGSSTYTSTATLSVGTAPVFTSANTTTFTVGQAGNFAVTVTGVPSATLSRTGAQFPAWLTLTDNGDGTGSLTGTPPAGSAGEFQFTLKAANGFSPSASQTFTLFVDDSPVITSADHTTFTVGSAGSFAVTTAAGFPTTTSITRTGALPSGVTFTDNGDGTATLAGTPAAGTGGSYPITMTATASGGLAAPATQSFTLTVLGPPVITSADHATFSTGAAGDFTVTTVAGNPSITTLTKTGTLPSGVTFTDDGDGTARISGTPNVGSSGVYTISITATNGVSPDPVQTFTLTVNEPAQITSADHATFFVGVADAFTVTTAGGQPTAVTIVETGSLPSGVTFTDNGDGTATLAGTADIASDGVYPLTVTASNGVLPNASQSFTLTISERSQSITVTSQPATPVVVGDDYTPVATSTSGLLVAFSVDAATTSGACTLSGGVVHFAHTGVCVLDADQSGDGMYAAATQVQQTITVSAADAHVPSITARVRSWAGRTHYLWYRSAVYVGFECTTHGAPLTARCPATVRLYVNSANLSVTRTIHSTDGGTATVSVTGIKIDTVRPTVSVTGIRNGAVYVDKAPPAHCVAHDALSGIHACHIIRTTSRGVTKYRAFAVDRAGNRRSITGSYRVK